MGFRFKEVPVQDQGVCVNCRLLDGAGQCMGFDVTHPPFPIQVIKVEGYVVGIGTLGFQNITCGHCLLQSLVDGVTSHGGSLTGISVRDKYRICLLFFSKLPICVYPNGFKIYQLAVHERLKILTS